MINLKRLEIFHQAFETKKTFTTAQDEYVRNIKAYYLQACKSGKDIKHKEQYCAQYLIVSGLSPEEVYNMTLEQGLTYIYLFGDNT